MLADAPKEEAAAPPPTPPAPPADAFADALSRQMAQNGNSPNLGPDAVAAGGDEAASGGDNIVPMAELMRKRLNLPEANNG